MSKFDEKLKKQLDVARREHHEAKIRANTKVYENKAIIGGTIVGCIQRLEAIRYQLSLILFFLPLGKGCR